MTARLAPARQSSERPKVSFVFPVHDPEYGGDLIGRTQRHLDALIALANRNQLSAEIIIVEWNPRADRALFRESLHWPDALGPVCLRFIEVPAEIHRSLPNADKIPIFEYIAKNAGIRRARGQFLLATNPDLFFSPALIRWLARTPLSPGSFYRVDRRDLSEEIPAGLNLARQLRFCSQHVGQVHALFGSYRPGDSDIPRRLKEEYDLCLHDPTRPKPWKATPDARLTFPADGLHRNASGDFFLMDREWWHRLRGYPELYTHAHIDAILCWVAASAGLVQELLPSRCHLYHQAHHRESRTGFPQTDKKPWYRRYQEAMAHAAAGTEPPMVVNLPDWGLANEVLPEWQASSRLVQVQVVTEANRQEQQSASALAAGEQASGNSKQNATKDETSPAVIRSELRHAQAELAAAGQKEAALHVALRKEQSARAAERAAAEKVLQKVQRARKEERGELKTALREAQAARRSELTRRHRLESSVAWRITWPIRRALAGFRSFGPAVKPSPDLHYVDGAVADARKQDVITPPKNIRPKKVRHAPADTREAGDRPSPVDSSAPVTTGDAPLPAASLEPRRSLDIAPLQVFTVPGDAPRVSVVTDSAAITLLDGAGSALAIAALLARHLGARLRLITLTGQPDVAAVGPVLAAHGIAWTDDMEFVQTGPERQDPLPLGDGELFLTTSWRSTRGLLPIAAPGQLVYFLQEDERMLDTAVDDEGHCVETLSNPHIRFIVKSRQLFDRLTQGPDSLPNILANGVWFEPPSTGGHADWEAALAPVLAHLCPERRAS